MRKIVITALVGCFAATTLGFVLPPAVLRYFSSPDGLALLAVRVSDPLQKAARARLSMTRINGYTGERRTVWQCECRYVPNVVLVKDPNAVILVGCWNNPGDRPVLAFLGDGGTTLKEYQAKDLFSADVIEANTTADGLTGDLFRDSTQAFVENEYRITWEKGRVLRFDLATGNLVETETER